MPMNPTPLSKLRGDALGASIGTASTRLLPTLATPGAKGDE